MGPGRRGVAGEVGGDRDEGPFTLSRVIDRLGHLPDIAIVLLEPARLRSPEVELGERAGCTGYWDRGRFRGSSAAQHGGGEAGKSELGAAHSDLGLVRLRTYGSCGSVAWRR